MTTLVAVTGDHPAVIGADQASADSVGAIQHRHGGKVVRRNLGTTTSPLWVVWATAGRSALRLALGDALAALEPEFRLASDLIGTTGWAEALTLRWLDVGRQRGLMDEGDDLDGIALVAVGQRAWELSHAEAIPVIGHEATGTGGKAAVAVLDALAYVATMPGGLPSALLDPLEVATVAVELAAHRDTHSRGPATVADTAGAWRGPRLP